MGDMIRYLVVANQTLVSDELMENVAERLRHDDCCFHLVVPATPLPHNGTWTNGEARTLAGQRLEHALKRFADFGAEATGEVGDANPMAAIADSIRLAPVDAIILATLPPGRSAWLRQDLPSRVARKFGLPLDHVVADRILEA